MNESLLPLITRPSPLPLFAQLTFEDAQNLEPFKGYFVVTLGLLILVLLFTLPQKDRKLVFEPLILLLLHFVALAGHLALALSWLENDRIHLPFWYIAIFFLICAAGRSLILIFTRSRLSPRFVRPLPRILLDGVHGLTYALALLLTLSIADVSTESLLAGSALITAGITYLLKDTLGNLFAGLAIQAQRPFEVLDWIQFDEQPFNIGKVLEINWRATRILTLDEVEVTIPNLTLAQVPIRNYTKPQRYSRRSIFVVAPYSVPTQRVQQIIREAAADAWGVEKYPEPSVVSNSFNERGVEYWVRVFTKEFGKRDKVDGSVRDRIWYALHRHGITIPGPIRQVELRDVGPEFQAEEQETRINSFKDALSKVDFLEELSSDDLDTLANAVQRRYYAEGENIVREDEPGTELFILHEGEVAASLKHSDGTVLVLDRLGPEAFFGEVSFLTGERRTATVTATQDCEIFVVRKEGFAPVLERSPGLAEHMSEVLAKRQAEVDSRVIQHESMPRDVISEKKRDLLEHIKDFFSI